MKYSYNFHLFTQLALLKDSSLNELEYDFQYAELINMFEDFERYDLKVTNNTIDLYESIENYLNERYN